MPAPRPYVVKGSWEIHNDTLVCYATHRNTTHGTEGKKIKAKPVFVKLIMIGEQIYACGGGQTHQLTRKK